MIRIGIVSAVDTDRVQARVTWDDLQDGENGGTLSNWLPVIQQGALGDCGYWLPRVGSSVVVAMQSNAIEEGYILGTFYNAEDTPPSTGAGVWYHRFADGTVIEYDPSSGVRIESPLAITIKGAVVNINP